MKISVGIIGLPNVGKSTLFQALTKKRVNIANYPFSTVDPNIAVVAPRDERLEKIAAVFGSKKIIPAALEFVDIAGLVKGAHEGQGLGNQFLAQIREVDAIIHLIRTFPDTNVPHLEGELDPGRDFQIIMDELRHKDEESKEKENLLSVKPLLVIFNGPPLEKFQIPNHKFQILAVDLKNEISEQQFQEVFAALKKLLNLITFFTANENEARSWLVEKDTAVKAAAGVIHTDFEQKFIKAEVVNWEKFLEAGGWPQAKNKGWLRLEGRDYPVREGDLILIKHG